MYKNNVCMVDDPVDYIKSAICLHKKWNCVKQLTQANVNRLQLCHMVFLGYSWTGPEYAVRITNRKWNTCRNSSNRSFSLCLVKKFFTTPYNSYFQLTNFTRRYPSCNTLLKCNCDMNEKVESVENVLEPKIMACDPVIQFCTVNVFFGFTVKKLNKQRLK